MTQSLENGNILPPKIPVDIACRPKHSGYRLWDPCPPGIRGENRGTSGCDSVLSYHQNLALIYSIRPFSLIYIDCR